jgi:hypothetical protein
MTRTSPSLFLAVAGLLLLAACGDDDDTTNGGPVTSTTGQGVLAGVCPSPVVVQTDWNPEAEHGALYEMAAPGGTVDTERKTYTAPLLAGSEDTGVDIEIRVGGPVIGSQTVSAQLYADEGILLGYVTTDEAIAFSAEQPTTAVVAPLERSPVILMFDPARYQFETFAAIGRSGADVLYFEGATYMDYLIGKGDISADQVDGSYDGSPAKFLASDGAVVQQGFATAEPYIYSNEISDWMKPVDYLLVDASGYEVYPQALAARPEVIEANADCFERLVPIIQQSQVDFMADPSRATALILDLIEAYDTGWIYSAGVAAFSVQAQFDNGIVADGPDATLGNFDLDRVARMIDALGPMFAEQVKALKPGLTAADIVTNDFIDPAIGLSGP